MSDKSYKSYLFEYPFSGEHWMIEIIAKDANEAKQRLSALSWAQYKGEVKTKIKVAPGFVSKLYGDAKRFVGKVLRQDP